MPLKKCNDMFAAIQVGLRKARKTNNLDMKAYYDELWVKYARGSLWAMSSYETWIGSWAGQLWLRRRRT